MDSLALLLDAAALAESAHDPFPALARLLNQLQQSDPHGISAFCLLSGMERRKAYYFAEIDRYLGAFDIPPERMVKIGWTKLQLIGPYAVEANLEKLLARAEMLSTNALKQFLAGQEPQTDSHCIQLYLTSPQLAIFTKKLAQNGYAGADSACSREEALISALKAAP